MKARSVARINFTIVGLCLAAIIFCAAVGLMPDERRYEDAGRDTLCKLMANQVLHSIRAGDLEQVRRQFESTIGHVPHLRSMGLRRPDGSLVVDVGGHAQTWARAVAAADGSAYMAPIAAGSGPWGMLEIRFQPIYTGVNRFVSDSMTRMLCVVGVLVGAACWLHLQQIWRFLDPNRSVPPRVRDVLNSFAEGVVVLDLDDRIVMVNNTFAEHVKKSQEALLGTRLWNLPWKGYAAKASAARARSPGLLRGTQLQLEDAGGKVRTIFSANSSPVLDAQGNKKGLMIVFADVTPLERNRAALLNTVQDLNRSKKEISEQNKQLRYLATRDPLTACINRRTFFELFEKHWNHTLTHGTNLCGVMVDIDFFKSINDTYGHSTGDEVLRQTGKLLSSMGRQADVVCRYGGEEFALLLPGLSIEEAEEFAEVVRIRISELAFPDFKITACLGVSAFGLGASTPQDMLDQADKCLYVAKRNGRNQVVRFDTVPANLLIDDSRRLETHSDALSSEDSQGAIPLAPVSALLSAVSYRDHQTGLHSARVSTYSALLAQKFMGPREVLVVEMAAMLHDFGKIGVPDAILLKPDELTPEEWLFMEKHERIGTEIVSNLFQHQGLREILKFNHCPFDRAGREQRVWGQAIPLGARILTIADAFDSMVSDRPYRSGMPIAEALSELRRCAGTQFDPELVEHFTEIIQSGRAVSGRSSTRHYSNDVVLSIGEQVEQLIQAADSGDGETFIALAERLRNIAQKHQVDTVCSAAERAIRVVSEDTPPDRLVEEAGGLLTACHLMHVNFGDTSRSP